MINGNAVSDMISVLRDYSGMWCTKCKQFDFGTENNSISQIGMH